MSENIKYKVFENSNSNYNLFEDVADTKPKPVEKKEEINVTESQINDATNTLNKKVREYIAANKPKLFILTPCYNGMCFVNYMTCLINTIELFKNLNFPIQIEFCKGDSLIPRARNNLIARAMSDPAMTHVMFIDNDITWNPVDILKLVIADKAIVGGIYPLKHYNWNKLVNDANNPYNSNIIQSWIQKKNGSQLKGLISDEDTVKYNLLSYNVNYLENHLSIEHNLAKVRHAPTGFLMITRDVFENMMQAFPSTKYTDDVHFLKPDENKFAYALFDCAVEEGHYFSEDWLFCSRWMKMGGEIYIDVSINLTHSGIEDFSGSYISSII